MGSIGFKEVVGRFQYEIERDKKNELETVESTCIDCGWKGAESEHHFLDGWCVCPKCHQAEFLVSGEELDEMNENEGVVF